MIHLVLQIRTDFKYFSLAIDHMFLARIYYFV